MKASLPNKIRVLIADDHDLVRKGLRAIMRTEETVLVVGEATTGPEVIRQTDTLNPDVIILDLLMPEMDAVEAIRHIRVHNPGTRVLILSTYDSEASIYKVMSAGADGYVLKSDSNNLKAAFHAVCKGQRYLSREVSDILANQYLGMIAPPTEPPVFCLTSREREVARLLSLGKSSKEIADSLDIAVRTVETHRANIMRKLNVHSVTELLNSAHSKKLIPYSIVGQKSSE